MRYVTLVVLRALITILEILFTDRLKGPNCLLMTIMLLDAVSMIVTCIVLFKTDTDFLAVTTLALAGNSARSTWIEHLFQIGGIFALCILFP